MAPRPIEYSALPSQSRFHDSPATFKAFCGPVGTGKSKALCQEAIKLSFQNKGCTGLIGAPTLRMLRDAALEQFLGICRKAQLAHTWNASDSVVEMHGNGSTVIFRSLDN